MKKTIFIVITFLIMLGVAIIPKNNASAYLTDQCFAIEYKKTSSGTAIDGDGTKKANTRVLSTDKICVSTTDNKKLRTSPNLPDNADGRLTMPTLKVVENNSAVKITYCENGSNVLLVGKCYGDVDGKTQVDQYNGDFSGTRKLEKTFNFSDYGYDIKKLANAVNGVVSPLQGTNDALNGKYEELAITDNTTKGMDNETVEQGQKDSKGGKDTCKGSGGAFGLEWVVCSVVTWMSKAADNVYNEYVEPSLQIEPQLFADGNDGVRDAWGVFQNFANILFVILLLFVIFSQLTGVGIDNYGIKKILPKLILAAVLINLSYLFCLIIIDVSNILGNSFYSLFKSLAEGISINNSIMIESDSISTEAIGGLAGVGLLTAVVSGGATIFANPAILLSLLVSAFAIMISIFFLFILLSAREAAIIVLVVVSPLAVILSILPNTKKVSDRWWKMFEGLLLVYPICGLLVGAGDYVSRLLLASGMGKEGFVAAFTAMIVSVVPIFFIPMVLRNSFAAMGNLGARISGFGQRVSNGATGLARGSQAYRNAQELGAERATRIRAGVDANGNAYEVGRLGMFMRGGRRNVARARSQYLSNQDARNRENNLMGVGFDAAMADIQDKASNEEVLQHLALMKRDGIMVGGQRQTFNLDNASARLNELSDLARNRELTQAERVEVSTLAHGMSEMKGGGGRLGRVIRNSDGGNGVANRNFMDAIGATVSADATVRNKLDEKDAGAATYAERFTSGGDGARGASFNDFRNQVDAQGNNIYNAGVQARIPSYEAGLNQGGDAINEYIEGLGREDCQNIMDNVELLNSLNVNDRRRFLEYASGTGQYANAAQARGWTVTERSAQRVEVV